MHVHVRKSLHIMAIHQSWYQNFFNVCIHDTLMWRRRRRRRRRRNRMCFERL